MFMLRLCLCGHYLLYILVFVKGAESYKNLSTNTKNKSLKPKKKDWGAKFKKQ